MRASVASPVRVLRNVEPPPGMAVDTIEAEYSALEAPAPVNMQIDPVQLQRLLDNAEAKHLALQKHCATTEAALEECKKQ